MLARKTAILFSSRGQEYSQKILSSLPGIIRILPCNETSGTTALDTSGNGRTGAYSGVTLDQANGPGASMGRMPRWDGVNDRLNGFTASFAAAFGKTEGSLAFFCQMFDVGVWSDGQARILARVGNGSDLGLVQIIKGAGLNSIAWTYRANSVLSPATTSVTLSTTSIFHACVTWSLTNNRTRFYINGTQQGATVTGLGTWTAAVTEDDIGGYSSPATLVHNGYMGWRIDANVEWTPAQVLIAATAL